MSTIRTVALVFSPLAMFAGGLGMAMSILTIPSDGMGRITCAGSFAGCAVLMAGGLVSLAVLSLKETNGPRSDSASFARRFGQDD